MIEVLTQPPQGVAFHQKAIIDYLRGNELVSEYTRCLDVGPRSPLTEAIEKRMEWQIDNTTGDLDVEFMPDHEHPYYDIITYSHTIEHQFNPLYTLFELKRYLVPGGRIYVALPQRGKLLWVNHHYHEIDDYRIRLLFKRAGLKVMDRNVSILGPRPWYHYVRGFRAFARLFFEKNVIYKLKI